MTLTAANSIILANYEKRMQPKIKTTVVGSYPVPSWLVGNSSRIALQDAIMTVLKTQELAGLDVISDGELKRFDPGHPETNGMIDYFVSQMEGVRTRFSLSDLNRFRSDRGLDYRAVPAGIVAGKIGDEDRLARHSRTPSKAA